MAAKQGEIKPKASGRASVPTPPVRFPVDDKPGQLTRKSRARVKSKPSRSFTGWLISFASRVTIFYLIYAAVWTCPSRPFRFDYSAKDARPVCRNLAQARDQIVPIVKPYYHLAQQKADPYTRPVIKAAKPWIKRAHKVSRPIYREADKRGRLLWKKRIDPARRRALKRAHKQIDPYLQQAHQYHKKNVQPHINTVHKAVKPYHDIYQRDVSPYVDQAYQYSLQSSSVSYAFYMDKVHPRVIQTIKQVYSFLVNHVSPALRRFYSLYVRPQLDRLLAKVYERKAHWLGSDAIKAAQQEAKQTAKEADKHAQQAVKQAEQEAIKARDDPSLLDRLKQAKESVYDSATADETDSVKAATLDAELEAEEQKVKDLLEVWETGMTDLIEKEYQLAVTRIAELRNTRLTDLPDRFGLINEAFVEDTVALILNRVERGLRKISTRSGDTEKDIKKKLDEGNKLVDQQLAKFDRAGQETKAQIAAYYEELLQQERQTTEASSAEVRRYASAAKDAYDEIMRNTKFSATMDEWHGWDMGVRKRAALFSEELSAVQSGKKAVSKSSGAVDLRKEAPGMQKEIKSLRAWTDKLHSSARKELIAYCDGALAELAGDGVAAKISDITDRLAEQANRISTDATAGMLAAVGSARRKMGLGEVVDEGFFARAKAYVASGTGSGSSFDDYVSSFNAKAAAASSSASSAAAKASSSVVSAVGASSSPVADAAGGVAANVRAAASSASDAAASVASSASSVAHQASRSVASAVGASPTPETAEDYIEAAKDTAEAATSRVGQAARSAASSASSAASVVSSAAGSAAGNVGDAVQSGASSVSSAASVVSRSAGSVASNVGSAAQSGASSASSAASVASKSASSALNNAGAAAQSGVSSASSAASVVPRSVSSAAQSGASSVSSAASVASKSASSALNNAGSAAESGASSASSLASAASRSVASAVGASPSPETFADRLEDVQDKLSEVAASGSSVVSKASRSVASAVGATPRAETVEDVIEDVKDAVRGAAKKVHVEL
ncbi:hypothetical protein PSEUBRA_001465 [Kalmanozyma brasiliensis GHG001]|uniref:Uncharacterized protein n=1 Tax=Kalmanozyma brasiliensis (strain GHG001) TaxID=1365824 RepID=V5EYF3_KALBG|nr:uncharacterized protein PSEUBRA_001465 [Kalmanozyma brasiliensis GHG001]EST08768.1 hypothetical protein PSEUBRA_001465 [Kalmanozyma brasiliensis GHG001]